MKLSSLAAFAVMSAVLAVLAVPVKAHHSFNTFFDMSRTIAIEGVVTSFRLVSPHSEMMVDVPDAGGKPVTWRITARTGAVNAKREGWKPEDFIGKKVKVEGNPTRRKAERPWLRAWSRSWMAARSCALAAALVVLRSSSARPLAIPKRGE